MTCSTRNTWDLYFLTLANLDLLPEGWVNSIGRDAACGANPDRYTEFPALAETFREAGEIIRWFWLKCSGMIDVGNWRKQVIY